MIEDTLLSSFVRSIKCTSLSLMDLVVIVVEIAISPHGIVWCRWIGSKAFDHQHHSPSPEILN